jgi:hypothetical protein
MKSKILLYTIGIVAVALMANLSVMPALAKPGEITIVVKDIDTKKAAVGANIRVTPPGVPYTGVTSIPVDAKGKVTIDTSTETQYTAGSTCSVYTDYGGGWHCIGEFTIGNQGSARLTLWVSLFA